MSHLTLNFIETKAKHVCLRHTNKAKTLHIYFYIKNEVTLIQSFYYNISEQKNWMSCVRNA